MYPLKIYFVRAHRGDLYYAWHDEGLSSRGDLTHARDAETVAHHVAEMMWLKDPAEARNCVKDPGQIRNLFDFTHPPVIREFGTVTHPETRALGINEQREFLGLVQQYLEEISKRPNEWDHMNP